jgi:hypothetical protein
MAFSGGVYTLPGPALNTGEIVSATENNSFRNDVATAFNLTFLRNGTSTATANLPMGGYKLTGLGAGTANGDSVRYEQVTSAVAITGGTINGAVIGGSTPAAITGTTITANTSFAGALNGTVGATTPNTGAFTTLTTSSTVTINGGTANSVAYLNGSKVLTTGSALTFDGTNFATTGTSSATKLIPTGGSATGNGMYLPASNTLAWSNNGSETMRLDSSGNLGLGVTPSAWRSTEVAFQFGDISSISNTGNVTKISTNAYWPTSGTATYLQNFNATTYVQGSGQHVWYTAPSGTAGSAISFTQAMTLDASGNLGIGTSSPTSLLHVYGANTTGGMYVEDSNSISASPLVRVRGNRVDTNGSQSFSGGLVLERYMSSGASGLVSGNMLGTIYFGGNYNAAGNFTYPASISAVADGNWTSTSAAATAIAFYTGSTGQALGTANVSFGTERMRIDSSGNVGIGLSPSTVVRLHVQSAGTTPTGFITVFENSSTGDALSIRNDGYISTGLLAASPYNATTGGAANLFVFSDGGLYRSTSSLKYKKNVLDATHGLKELLTLRPVTYEGKSKADEGKTFGGLIAEEVHDAGLAEFVQYADDGTPDALAYGNMVSLCIKAIQELKAQLDESNLTLTSVKAELDATKAEVAALKKGA